MKRARFFNKKTIVALGVCFGLAGYLFVNHRNEAVAADVDTEISKLNISYHQCENNMELVLDEDVCETISVQVLELEEQGKAFEVSNPIELEDGYYQHITKDNGHTVVAGIRTDKRNYVVIIESDKTISDEEAKEAIEDLQEKLA